MHESSSTPQHLLCIYSIINNKQKNKQTNKSRKSLISLKFQECGLQKNIECRMIHNKDMCVHKEYVSWSTGRHWNMLPRAVVAAPSLKVFKARLDRALSSLV